MKFDSQLYASPALLSSADLAWKGLQVEHHQLAATQLPPHYHQHHLLLLHLQVQEPVVTRRRQGKLVQEAVFRTGDLGLYPGGEYGTVSWDNPSNTLHLYVDDQHLDQLADQVLNVSRVTLQDQLRFNDELLNQLGNQLLRAVGTSHSLGLLYVESLTNALFYHLLEHYATIPQAPRPGRGLLSAAVLKRLDEYIEAHAEQVVTLEALAAVAHLSVYHFSRIFRRTTGFSPYQYVLQWKIRRACQLLRNDWPVAAVSDTLGFASPAHFSAFFKQRVGQPPTDFQRRGADKNSRNL